MACACSVCFDFRHAVSSGYSKEEKLVDQLVVNANRHTIPNSLNSACSLWYHTSLHLLYTHELVVNRYLSPMGRAPVMACASFCFEYRHSVNSAYNKERFLLGCTFEMVAWSRCLSQRNAYKLVVTKRMVSL
jgi:hypothetical protein